MRANLETIVPRAALVVVLGAALAACGAQRQHQQIQQVGEELRFELAELYVKKGARQAAVPLLKKILSEEPRDVRARVLYGMVLRDLGLHLQAERELAFALEIEPDHPSAHAALGILYDLQRKPEAARRHHERAVALAPGHADYLNNLGFSLYLAGESEAAINWLERALALDPSLGVAYNNLGFAYGRTGDFERAEKAFSAALDEAATLVNMALVYEEHGRDEDAGALRARAYLLDPGLRPAEEMDL